MTRVAPRLALKTLLVAVAALTTFASPQRVNAQNSAAVAISPDGMTAYAKAYLALADVRDKAQAELADPRNKKVEVQLELRDKLRTRIAAVLKEHKLTAADYDLTTHAISVSPVARSAFEVALGALTPPRP